MLARNFGLGLLFIYYYYLFAKEWGRRPAPSRSESGRDQMLPRGVRLTAWQDGRGETRRAARWPRRRSRRSGCTKQVGLGHSHRLGQFARPDSGHRAGVVLTQSRLGCALARARTAAWPAWAPRVSAGSEPAPRAIGTDKILRECPSKP